MNRNNVLLVINEDITSSDHVPLDTVLPKTNASHLVMMCVSFTICSYASLIQVYCKACTSPKEVTCKSYNNFTQQKLFNLIKKASLKK